MSLPYEIRDSPIHGQGLFTTRSLAPGHLIMSKPVALKVQKQTDKAAENRDMYAAFKAAPPDIQRSFQQLVPRVDSSVTDSTNAAFSEYESASEREEATDIVRIWLNNSFSDDAVSWVCFERTNHSCTPNAFLHRDGDTHHVRAVRSITAGEEVLLSYVDSTEPAVDRQEKLQSWGFTCKCAACSLTTDEAKAGEEKRLRLEVLFFVMEDNPFIEEREEALQLMGTEPGMLNDTIHIAEELANLFFEKDLLWDAKESFERAHWAAAVCYGLDHQYTRTYKENADVCRVGLSGPGPIKQVRRRAKFLDTMWS